MNVKHLPGSKQDEIAQILQIIQEEADPVKVILFGSHATGKWVDSSLEEDGVTLSYLSDYDFLVVTRDNSTKEHQIISHIENRCNQEFEGIVSIIVHSIDYINTGLSYGQFFFTRIIHEGITLFDSEEYEFIKPKALTKEQLKERAQDYFDIWFPMGEEFLIDANNAFERRSFRKAVFELHQAAENFYGTVLLVFSGYKPTVHNLQKLRNYSKHLNEELYKLFLTPSEDDYEANLFNLLRRGYIEARYKKNFEITERECSDLVEKVKEMKRIVHAICLRKIESII
ncbi:HEPN domain-containing protein [Litoribacter populi]|uniref:HEPN domain-containing protein n=1 Tax=Litoribacter populi TaxID=2598460 RepID=UPI0011802ADC|nr:HEPN domain-containing protein [Litoribacter populi]